MFNFHRFLTIGHFFLKDALSFRASFFITKLREVLSFLTILIFWYAVLIIYQIPFGSYTPTLMFSYFAYTFIIQQIISTTRLHVLGNSIISGEFTRLLLYPIAFLPLFLAWETIHKAFNLFIALIYVLPLFYLLKNHLYFPSVSNFATFLPFLLIGLILFTLLTLIINSLAFYTTELWAVNFLLLILTGFLNGGYFPLDLLGPWATLNPFAYLNYWPSRLLLGSVNFISLTTAFWVGLLWILIFYLIYRFSWSKGLRRYTGWGT